MTKADIVECVYLNAGGCKKDSVELVESVFSAIKETLQRGETLKITGFGNFVVRAKSDRKGRNPQTGETITIEARRIISFKPSNVLRNAINK